MVQIVAVKHGVVEIDDIWDRCRENERFHPPRYPGERLDMRPDQVESARSPQRPQPSRVGASNSRSGQTLLGVKTLQVVVIEQRFNLHVEPLLRQEREVLQTTMAGARRHWSVSAQK